jgi:O-antigen/teichoic acid export membrane protein
MASETTPAIAAVGSNHRRFAVNVAANLGSLVITVFVGLWYTPFMIRSLGVAVYGLVPLASSITNYLTVVTGAVCTMVARYITTDLARNDTLNANKHFNTFLIVGTLLAAALFVFAVVFSFFLPVFFNIPSGQEQAARSVFLGVAGAFLILTIANTFQSSIWVSNRFEIRAMIEASSTLLRAGLVWLSFRLWAPALWQVSIIIPAVAAFVLLSDFAACRKLAPSLRVRLSDFDRSKLPELLSTSQWLFWGQLGNLLFLNIDLVLVNITLGPLDSGRYAPLLQWVMLLRVVMSLVAGTLSPEIVVRYARQDTQGLLQLTRQAAKFLGLVVALPCGLLCGLGRPMLGTWLGPSFMDLAALSWLVLVPLSVEASQYHLAAITIAANKLRVPALSMLAFGVGNAALAILLTRHFHWGLYGVAAASAITSILRNGVFSPLYTAAILHQPWSTFITRMGNALVACLLLAGAAAIVAGHVTPGSWIRLGVAAAPLALVYTGLMYFIGLDADERITFQKIVLSSLRIH